MSKFLTEQDLDYVTGRASEPSESYEDRAARVASSVETEKPKYAQSYEAGGPRAEAWQNYLGGAGQGPSYSEIEPVIQARIKDIPVYTANAPVPYAPEATQRMNWPLAGSWNPKTDYVLHGGHGEYDDFVTSHELGHALDPELMAQTPSFAGTSLGDVFAGAGEYNKNLIQQTFPGTGTSSREEMIADSKSLLSNIYDQYLEGNRSSPAVTAEDIKSLRSDQGVPYGSLRDSIINDSQDATDEEIADTLNKLVRSTPAADQKSTERIAENKTNYNNSGTKRLRISKNELKQIIQEELDFLLTEGLYGTMKQTYQDARDFVSSPTEFVADRGSAIARDRGIHPEQIVTGVGEDLGEKYLGPYLGPAYETYATYDDFMPRFVRNLVPHTAGEKLLPDEGRYVGEWYAKKIGRDLANKGYSDFVHKHGYDKYGLE